MNPKLRKILPLLLLTSQPGIFQPSTGSSSGGNQQQIMMFIVILLLTGAFDTAST
jgi:hypothetical protein